MIGLDDRKQDRRWYLLPKEEVARAVCATVKIAIDQDMPRWQEMRELARLFEEHGRQTFFAAGLNDATVGPLPRNVMRGLVETAHSLLVEATPRPFYGCEGGEYELRQRLEELNEAISGLFLQHDLDDFDSTATLHGSLWGTGVVKIDAITHTKKPRVRVERVYPWEVLVDPLDAVYGTPSTFYLVRWVDKHALMDLWPRKKEIIGKASTDRPTWASHLESMADPIRLVEAWHIDQDGGETGRHIIALESGLLVDEEYPYDAPPLCFFFYGKPLTGFWPDGLGHVLRGQQIEVNAMMDLIHEIVALCGSPGILIEKNSEIEEGHLDNNVARVIKWSGNSGQKPDYFVGNGLTNESRQHLLDTVAAMYERAGIPQTMATGNKPADLQSGRALRIHAALASGRLRVPAQNRQRFYLAMGHALIRAQRAVAAVDPEAMVVFTDPKTEATRRIKWADVDIDDQGIRLIAQAISKMPSTPEAKAELLEQYMNAGIISSEEYRAEVDLPDLKSLNGPATAPRKLIEKQLQSMLRTGRREVPEPFFPLATCKLLGLQYYAQGLLDGAPASHLAMVREYILAAADMEKPPAPPPTPPPGAEMAPSAGGMPPIDPNLPPPDMTTTAPPPGLA